MAEEVGRLIAGHGAQLICGGLGGVMEAACRGAALAGGVTVGILPGTDEGDANEFVSIVVPSGLDEARNAVIVNSSHSIVSIGGSWGTLSEIALALKNGKECVSLEGWTIVGTDLTVGGTVTPAESPSQAVEAALAAAYRMQG
jgi:uncharacterized protein (TIGR00725 family)